MDDLYAAFNAADNILLKKYVSTLSSAPCIEMADELKSIPIGDNVALYRVAQVVYDMDENIQDKLTTVYSTVFSLKDCALTMLLDGHRDSVDLYVGVVTRNFTAYQQTKGDPLQLSVINKQLQNNGQVLRNAFLGNFPGTKLIPVNNVASNVKNGHPADSLGKADIIEGAFNDAKFISAVSSIPAVRNANGYKNQEFVQGLEKLIDTLRGKEYTAMILANVVDNHMIEQMCAEYEDIYSQLVPFLASSQTVNTQKSVTDTESIIKGVTDTTNQTLTKSLSHGTSSMITNTESKGHGFSVGASFIIGANYNRNWSKAESRAEGKTDLKTESTSSGTSKSLTEQNSVAQSLSTANGESVQINYENRAVKTLLGRLDEQIQRMRNCEDFGIFDTCAYFAAKEQDVSIAAASAFRSVTRGENSSVESSAVNMWDDPQDVEYIKDYLMRFYHPEFLTLLGEEHKYPTTATMMISGREMAYQMPLPKKSVSGIPVVDCAEFGREVVSLADPPEGIPLGCIFHMHKQEDAPVILDSNNLTAHTFITGSTGSGKSTTIYKLLDELSSIPVDGTDETVKFMVVEPAKGEYKNALATRRRAHVNVYGTNPTLTQLLRIDPFRFPSDQIHIYEHLDRLTEIFNVCWPMYAAMPAVLKASIENAYRSAGWDLMRSENKHGDIFPTFLDVAREVNQYINQSEYSEETKGNYKGSLLTRLESLTNGINRLIFASDGIPDAQLFDEDVIIDLSRIGSTDTKALIMGILVLKLQEYRIATYDGANAGLRHVTVLEEAHHLLKRTSTEQSSETANLLGKSVEMLANSIAEMRTYGEGFIIADQSPGLLDLSVIRNTNTKIILRLPDYSDRELVGRSAGLNDNQIIELAKLPRGVAAVHQNDWVSPVLCQVELPRLGAGQYSEPSPYPSQQAESIFFDFLDAKLTHKLDMVDEKAAITQAVLHADVPAKMKLQLLDCLHAENDRRRTLQLASLLFEAFKNTKDVLDHSIQASSVEALKSEIVAHLEPSVQSYDPILVDNLLVLLFSEYARLYHLDYPIWREFAVLAGRRGPI